MKRLTKTVHRYASDGRKNPSLVETPHPVETCGCSICKAVTMLDWKNAYNNLVPNYLVFDEPKIKKFGTISMRLESIPLSNIEDLMTVTVTNSSFSDVGEYIPEDRGAWEIFEFIPIDGGITTLGVIGAVERKELVKAYATWMNTLVGKSIYGIRPYTKPVVKSNRFNRIINTWFDKLCNIIPDSWVS
jgi:hypothetical protein